MIRNNYTEENPLLQAISSENNATRIKILNYLIKLYKKYRGKVFPSQTLIAIECGVTRETVNRHIADFTLLGYISTTKRYNDTSLYDFNPYLLSNYKKLGSKFSHLTYFCLTLLTSIQSGGITSRRNLNIYLYAPATAPTHYSKSNYEEKTNRVLREEIEVKKKEIQDIYSLETELVLKSFGEERSPLEAGAVVMNEAFIKPELRKVTEALSLTKWGQIRLMIFPEEVLAYTLKDFSHKKGIKDPFAWFFSAARSYCETKGIHVEWGKYYHLRDMYKEPANPEFVIKKVTIPITRKERAYEPEVRIEEDPRQVIHKWEAWMVTEECKAVVAMLGSEHLIWPHVRAIIKKKQLSPEEIDNIIERYPFLTECSNQKEETVLSKVYNIIAQRN